MSPKENRAFSFLIIAMVYLLAAAAGIGVFAVLPLDTWLSLLIADVAATFVVFLFSVIFKNASVYDPYWSVQPIVILIAFAAVNPVPMSAILVMISVMVWGIRLTANWAYTFKNLNTQDWRYTMLEKKTGKFYPLVNFVGIHLVPTLVVYACTLPAVYLILDAPALNAGGVIFFLVSLAAVLLQGTADVQMHVFRKEKRSGFIRTGVWKYSRHPNYLGEILMWWGVALASLCVNPARWYLIAGAVLNTCLFLFVSIPMADKHQSRKRGFEAYKQNTRMLLPIYKKQR